MKKFLGILLTTMILLTGMMSIVLADVEFNSGTFTPSADKINEDTKTKVGGILGAIQWIGYAIAVGMLIYVGIKYVMSSAQDKADLKNNLIRYVIGAIIIAGASTILGWITGLA